MKALWHPEPNHKGNSEQMTVADKPEGIIAHHEVMHRLEAFDTARGMRLSFLQRQTDAQQEQRSLVTEASS